MKDLGSVSFSDIPPSLRRVTYRWLCVLLPDVSIAYVRIRRKVG